MSARQYLRPAACALAAALACGASTSRADQQPVAAASGLDAVVVTATSLDGRLRDVPHGISVINAEDIERSTAVNLPDLLSREAGVSLRSYYGGRSNAGIDIRGMGETAGSNVLVLLDGVPLNEVDMSGADLGALDLSQIERIEILRGGGAVRWGNGAVGGVVNILTRGPRREGAEGSAGLTLGSYGRRELRGRAALSNKAWSLGLVASNYASNGWRENAGERGRDASFNLAWTPDGLGPLEEVYLRGSHHRDRYGMPGPVPLEDFRAGDAERRRATYPDDHSGSDVSRLTFGTHADFGAAGRLQWQLTGRERSNRYFFGFDPQQPSSRQGGLIDSSRHEWDLRHTVDFQALGGQQQLQVGTFGRHGALTRQDGGLELPGVFVSRKRGQVDEGGWFAETRWVFGPLQLQGGVRRNRFESRLFQDSYAATDWQQDTAYAGNWVGRAAELGATLKLAKEHTLFASLSRHFRGPNIDELAFASDDLHPQQGRTSELGWRFEPGPRVQLSLTGFEIVNRDEIYYGVDPVALTSYNRNYERRTRRTGGEAGLKLVPLKDLVLRFSAGYVKPRFVGDDSGDIPLVPRTTLAAELDWALREDMNLVFSVRRTGSRRDGLDTAGSPLAPLPAYTVCDIGWRWRWKQLDLSAGINNLFDRSYSTLGYYETYYPMPGRNWTVSASWRF